MEEFTVHRDPDGSIESKIRSLLTISRLRNGAENGPRESHAHVKHGFTTPMLPPTIHIPAHPAAIQLYARASQLSLAETLMARSKLDSNLSCICSNALESMRHIVDCRIFEGWRTEAGR
jgi:hypothetical protein